MKTWWQKRSLRARLALSHAAWMALGLFVWTAILVSRGKGLSLNFLVFGGALTTFGFGISSYFMAGRLLEPFRKLAEEIRRFASGHREPSLQISEIPDDFGFSTSLQAMVRHLENSLVAVDRLTADVSHELRTPLTAMRSAGEVALEDRNPETLRETLGGILEEIGRMNQLIDRLLLLTRPGQEEMPLQLEAALVRVTLLGVVDTLGLLAKEKNQFLEVDCPEHLLAVFDPALLRLALMNLIQNAIRYSPEKKRVLVRAFGEGPFIFIEVADEGPGIASEHQGKIFERFYRVDKARSRAEGGVGLGLALVKWSVERMKGTVEVKSEPGRGSVFRLCLRTVRSWESSDSVTRALAS